MKIRNVGRKMQAGFTLIELMITVAIVGILAAVALPAYQDYTIRAQVTEGFTLADGMKTPIIEAYANSGVLPADNAAIGASATGATGKYVTGVTNLAGVITSTFGGQANAKIAGGTISLTPLPDANGVLKWTCAYDGTKVVKKYVPSSCN